MISESAYVEILKNCAKFNGEMSRERVVRSPFIDPQTGIAQRPGALYRRADERIQSRRPDEVVAYPPRRYRRKLRSQPLRPEILLFGPLPEPPVGLDPLPPPNGVSDPSAPTGIESDAPHLPPPNLPTFSNPPREAAKMAVVESAYLDDEDDEMEEAEDLSDGEDYAESYKKGKGAAAKAAAAKGRSLESSKKTSTGAPYTVGKDGKKRYFGGAAAALIPPEEKPYICPRKNCDARYKSKPGLNYHLAHVHSDFNGIQSKSGGGMGGLSETTHPSPNTTITTAPVLSAASPAAASVPAKAPTPGSGNSEGAHPPNDYCDFCLGTGDENKKTGQPEVLTSCHDCGRSGHPTCLKFTANMIVSTKKYGWQCIECKSCAICGTSENDECLLFCDDCDRGFHLYCLTPRLDAPPEGEWSCHLCQVEFGAQASRPLPHLKTPSLAGDASLPPTLPPPPPSLPPTLPPLPQPMPR